GLDLVVHYDLPEDHKAYVHRSGRTARGGAEGVVASLVPRHQVREVVRLQKVVGLESGVVQVSLADPGLAGISRGEECASEPVEVAVRQERSESGFQRGARSSYRGRPRAASGRGRRY
nr:helicase-related protein [Actinomycetota bacterium]